MSHTPTDGDFTPPDIAEINNLLTGYEVLSFIAKGGMGAVYHARQLSLDRDVAIKVLPRHFGEDESFRESFATEAKSMAVFNHPNLIGIFDFGQVDGMLYIIMELVKGESLYHHAYGKIFTPEESTRIVSAISDGLASAHSHGILHRDIKPANILLDSDLSPKIGDFGLARQVGIHETGEAFGTPGYTAPEVLHNPQAIDESTDLYALGVILYELLTGKVPGDVYENASTLVGSDPAYDQIIRRAMHPSPPMRFRKAEDFSEALKKISTKKGPSLVTSNSNNKVNPRVPKSLMGAAQGANPRQLAQTAGTGVAPAQQISSASSQTAKTNAKSNIAFIRNIFIILALLGAIYFTWEQVNKARANREAEQAKVDAAREADRITKEQERQAALDAAAAIAAKKKSLAKKPDAHRVDPYGGTPKESLERLQEKLAAGDRTILPVSSFNKDGRARMYISEKMTWHQAQGFCEQHGAHIATVKDSSELEWLCDKLTDNTKIWLGAGSAGRNRWAWIDGSPWNLEIRDTTKAAYVSANNIAILTPTPASKKHTFYMEWLLDQSNPASLESQLERCAKSLSSDKPHFPAGTISYDNGNYLIIPKKGNWKQALNLAKLAGGHLATASNADENFWLSEFIGGSIVKKQSCWIGAFRPANKKWQWANGEPWSLTNWKAESPNNKHLKVNAVCAVNTTKLWADYPSYYELSHFIIEWSDDGKDFTANADAETIPADIGTNPKLSALKNKCVILIEDIQQKHEKKITENIKAYEADLRSYLRKLTEEKRQLVTLSTDAMTESYPDNRIPIAISRDDIPDKVNDILDDRLRRQRNQELAMLPEIEKIRVAYRKNLQKILDEFAARDDYQEVSQMTKELKVTSTDTKSFTRYMLNTK